MYKREREDNRQNVYVYCSNGSCVCCVSVQGSAVQMGPVCCVSVHGSAVLMGPVCCVF